VHYVKTILLFLCFPISILSQDNGNEVLQKQMSFKSLTIEDGLSQNSVVSIAQDSIGYLWFATQDGLNRYDGKRFKIYNKQFTDITRPTYSKLGKVFTDRKGQLWSVTISGVLEKYIAKKDSFFTVPRFKDVSSIYQDNHHNYYVGTYGNGIYKISKNDTLQILRNTDKEKDIYGFYKHKNAVFAVATNAVIEIAENASYSVIQGKHNFSAIAQTKNKTLWIGSFGGGLYTLKNKTLEKFSGFQNYKLPEDLNIQSLLVDKKDRLWITTYGNGVYLVDFFQNTLLHFVAQKTNPFALHYNDILCVYQDQTGTIWLGSDGAGLSYYDEHLAKFNILTNNQTPANVAVDVVRSICTDDENSIWLGTSGKGLTKYNRQTEIFTSYATHTSNISSNRVMSLLFYEDLLWIGFQGKGLNTLDKTGNFRNYSQLENYTIWKIFKDSKGQIWLATRANGLLLFDKDKGILKTINTALYPQLTSNNVRTVEEGKHHILWIGTEDNGLFKFDFNSDTLSKIDKVSNKIKALKYQRKTDVLWIGTNGNGLEKYAINNNTVQSYTKADGLPNNVIYSVLEDNQEQLWLSSNRGISKVMQKDALHIVNYNNFDGLQALEFNTGAYFKDEEGYLYFGGLEGVNWFKPSQLTKNPIAPKTVITGLEVFSKPKALIKNQSFDYNENTITFTFAGLHFSLPERNNYQYQLVNHDANWIQAGNSNSAHYTNLEPNTYTFKVKSSNYDGVWSKTDTSYTFTIKQPWYLTTTAKCIYVFLIVLSMVLLYRYLKWRWQIKMQLQMEHAETERLKKLDEFKTKLYTNISHEFRTPLTLISGPIERQLSKDNLSQQDKEELNLVQRNSKRLLNLVNQLLDLSKLESGSLKLSVSKDDLQGFLKQIISAFEYKAKEKDIHFTKQISFDEQVYFDKDVIEKITSNLLSNAIKYTPEKGFVSFNAFIREGQLVMSVVNNGNTLQNSDLSKLFKRFYQTSKTSDGVGVGLALVKELATLSYGNVVANTLDKDEIQFTVTLPIDKSYFNTSEIVETPILIEDDRQSSKFISTKNTVSKTEQPLLLIVEDDIDVRQFIRSIFQSEFSILEANNGERGIKKAIEKIPDLIISDVMMPVKDGIELCNVLKSDERTSHIPIILLTAKAGEAYEITGLKTGADAYITKPFSSDKLKVRVQKLIEIRHQLQKRYSQELKVDAKHMATSSVDQQFFKRIQDVLDAQLTNPEFNSKTFVDAMQMSRMQLHRKLKALTGLSTSEFIRSQRLKLAIHFLENSDLTVSEIAYQVGFNTPSYFIKCFKDTYNCTPSTFISK